MWKWTFLLGIVSFGVGAYFIAVNNYIIWNPLSCSSSEQLLAIRELNLSDVHRCETNPISVDGTIADLVEISYGQGMDCPSGCLFPSIRVLVLNGRAYASPQEASIERLMSKAYGEWCGIPNGYNGDVVSRSLHHISDTDFVWLYRFDNHSTESLVRKYIDENILQFSALGQPNACVVNGTLAMRYVVGNPPHTANEIPNGTFTGDYLQTIDELQIEADLTALHVSLTPLTDYPPISIKSYVQMCMMRQNYWEESYCYEHLAWNRNDITLCDSAGNSRANCRQYLNAVADGQPAYKYKLVR